MTAKTETIKDLYLNHTPESSGGLFLKFEDDKEVRVRIASDPYILESRYEDKTTHEVTTNNKYAWVVINRANDLAQIMQLPGGAYNQIAGLIKDEEYGLPDDYDLKITRNNVKGKYSYQVVGSPKRSATTEEEMALALAIDIKAPIQKDGTPIMSLREYEKAGKKFPKDNPAREADGTPVITDLDDDSNPLDSLPE